MPKQRTTVYGDVDTERVKAGLAAGELAAIINTPARKYERVRTHELVRNEI